jgi:adenine deaminase
MRIAFKANLIKRLGRVALGLEPADIILTNGHVLNVYTGEVLKNHQVLIAGDRIAYVGPEQDFPAGSETRVIDSGGQLLIPGLIDGHIHMDAWMEVGEFVRLSLPHGTTTIITECTSPADALGTRGVLAFLKQFQNQPQRFFATAPVISFLCSNYGDNQKSIDLPGMQQLLEQPEILGLGEIYWPNLLNGGSSEELAQIIEYAISLDKTVEGHGAGARNRKLAAMAAHGVDSCHEPITAEEVRDRLQMGLFTMIREGSVRRELEAVIKPLVDLGIDLRRAILVSDGIWPGVLIRQGHMDQIVQKAIDLGLDPVTAIRMATLNVAEHFHLDGDLGGIAPGKCADIVIIPDLGTIKPRLVICKGIPVARDGKMLVPPAKANFPAEAYQCVKLPPVQPDFFRIKAGAREARVRVLDLITSIVNRESVLTLPVVDGEAVPPVAEDVIKVAVIDRYSGTGRGTTGLIKGFGLSRGALASSFSFDEGNLVVIGCNDNDMAAAVNRIRKLGGGMVYCAGGRVVEEIPLPVFGSISELSGTEVAAGIESLEQAIRVAGCRVENPLLTLFTITFTAIPSIRLLARGYWLAKEQRVVGVMAD